MQLWTLVAQSTQNAISFVSSRSVYIVYIVLIFFGLPHGFRAAASTRSVATLSPRQMFFSISIVVQTTRLARPDADNNDGLRSSNKASGDVLACVAMGAKT